MRRFSFLLNATLERWKDYRHLLRLLTPVAESLRLGPEVMLFELGWIGLMVLISLGRSRRLTRMMTFFISGTGVVASEPTKV